MFPAFKLAQRAYASWSGLNRKDVSSLIWGIMHSDRLKLKKHEHYGTNWVFEYLRPIDPNRMHRERMAENFCSYLLENTGIKAVISGNDIVFRGYEDSESKRRLLHRLADLTTDDHRVGIQQILDLDESVERLKIRVDEQKQTNTKLSDTIDAAREKLTKKY